MWFYYNGSDLTHQNSDISELTSNNVLSAKQ